MKAIHQYQKERNESEANGASKQETLTKEKGFRSLQNEAPPSLHQDQQAHPNPPPQPQPLPSHPPPLLSGRKYIKFENFLQLLNAGLCSDAPDSDG